MNDFIEEYLDVVNPEECNYIIDYFENNPSIQIAGLVGPNKVDTALKNSTDIHMDIRDTNKVNDIIISAIDLSLRKYKIKYNLMDSIDSWSLYSGYNLQRYLPGQGYPAVHAEQSGSGKDSDNVLVWTLYLNDVTDNGGTFFPYQNRVIEAKSGKFLLFPAPWTHMHNGIISNTQTKYIATGWFKYYA